MQFSTVAMILTASVAHAVWNIASKYKKEDTLLFVWAYSCASALLWVPISLILTVEGQQELTGDSQSGQLSHLRFISLIL